jgi:hypothetical protein
MSAIQVFGQTSAVIGVLLLNAQYPKLKGDVGHPETFGVRVHFEYIKGIWPDKVVASAASLRQARLVTGFQSIIRNLQLRGTQAITTNGGFLVLLQKELQSVAKIPVVTSSLLQLPALLAKEPQVGVLTLCASMLSVAHLRAAGVPKDRLQDVIVSGMPVQTEFVRQTLGKQPTLDLAQAEKDVIFAALALRARAPQLKTLLLECAHMAPYKAALEAATGWHVRSLIDDPRLRKVIEATAATPTAQPQDQNATPPGESA